MIPDVQTCKILFYFCAFTDDIQIDIVEYTDANPFRLTWLLASHIYSLSFVTVRDCVSLHCVSHVCSRMWDAADLSLVEYRDSECNGRHDCHAPQFNGYRTWQSCLMFLLFPFRKIRIFPCVFRLSLSNSHLNLALAMHALCAQSTQCHQNEDSYDYDDDKLRAYIIRYIRCALLQQQHDSTYFCCDDLLSMNAPYRIHHPAATATKMCPNEIIRCFHLVRWGQPRW